MNREFRKHLSNAGIADSRQHAVEFAMERLHDAVCSMDGYNKATFWAMVECHGGMRGFLKNWAEMQDGLNSDV